MEQETVIRTGVTLPLKLAVRCLRPVADGVARMVSLLWWPIFLSSSVLGVGTTALHFIAHGYVELERDARVGISDAWASTVRWAAENTGYELTVPSNEPSLNIDDMIERECLRRKRNPSLCRAIAHVESRNNPDAVSPKGAIGVFQVMPANAKRCGTTPNGLRDPKIGIPCGTQLIDEDLDSQDGHVVRALWQYNGGPKCVDRILRCGTDTACMGGCVESYNYADAVLRHMANDIRG